MELVRGALQLPAADYALDDRLREIGYGEWEGSKLPQMQASHPELFARRQVDMWNVPPPDGESYASVAIRLQDWYRSLQVDTVAVAHGGTARALMVALGIETADGALGLTIEQGAVYVFSGAGLTRHS
jgi:broad specificity phosphatase PhoE